MEERKMEKKPQIVIVAFLLACILIAMGITVGYFMGRKFDFVDIKTSSADINTSIKVSDKKLEIMSVSENGDWIDVKTSYISFKYPFAFSDIIEVESYNDAVSSQLRFYSNLEGNKTLNYVIHFNSDEGLPCGTLKLQNDIPVSVEFKKASDGLSEDWLSTFYAVQETFNDVLKSMEENEKFFGVDS